MYSVAQLHYLKVMGIPAWESRDSASPVMSVASALESEVQSKVEEADLASWLLTQPLQQLGGKSEPLYALGPSNSALLILSDCKVEQSIQSDLQPFLGAAGKLLDAMLKAIGQSRTSCQLAAVAPAGENDLSAWVAKHTPRIILYFVRPNIEKPQLFEPSACSAAPVLTATGAHCFVSYHPEYLLQHPELKRRTWEDLKAVRRILD